MEPISETGQKIAAALGETEEPAFKTIERIIRAVGEDRALTLLEEALELEAGDGLLTDDGSRRRSPGGVYFKVVKTRLTSRERWAIFVAPRLPKKEKEQKKPAKKQIVPPTWEELLPLAAELLTVPQKGVAFTMKMTLIGRPGKIIEKGETVLTSLQAGKAPSLPKGLPAPPAEPTTYLVFIAKKQWQKVREAIKDPEDKLIVEGFPILDKRIGDGALTVYAQMVTTTHLQRAKREEQQTTARGT